MRKINNILILTPDYYPTIGGISEQCFMLAHEFTLQEIKVDILTDRKKGLSAFDKIQKIPIYRLDYFRSIKIVSYLFASFNLGLFFLKNRNKYDLIIIRQLNFNSLLLGLFKFLNIVTAVTFVTADSGGENDEVISLCRSSFKLIYKFLLNQHNLLNSISPSNYPHYLKLGIKKDKLTKINNGINVTEHFKHKPPKSIKTFAFLGRLEVEKGVKELLLGFQKAQFHFPEINLIIGGDGPLKEFLINFIEENNLEKNIQYIGLVSSTKKKDFFNNIDCLVLPSYSEGSPIVLMEATLNKKLIISTDVSNVKELYGRNIIIINKKDIKSLEEALLLVARGYSLVPLDFKNAIGFIDIKKTTQSIIALTEKLI